MLRVGSVLVKAPGYPAPPHHPQNHAKYLIGPEFPHSSVLCKIIIMVINFEAHDRVLALTNRQAGDFKVPKASRAPLLGFVQDYLAV